MAATMMNLHLYSEFRLRLTPELHNHRRSSCFAVASSRSVRRWSGDRRRLVCRALQEEREQGGKEEGTRVRALRSLKSTIVRMCKWPSTEEYRSRLAKLEEVVFFWAQQVGRYIVTMMSTGVILLTGFQISGGDPQMNDLIWYSWLGGIIIGTMVGANMVLEEHSRAGPRNVVITGSTRGLGKALAREFLLSGDRVVVTSRSAESVDATVKELQRNLQELIAVNGKNLEHAKVVGIACDVCDPDDVKKLSDFAVNELGTINIWINNAGVNKGFRPLLEFSNEDIEQIVSTNLVGSILCTREAMQVMRGQANGGHIFNMDGAGSGGSSTPLTAVYGSTKCGLRQLQASLFKECKGTKVGMHTASPGMVLTELLLSGATLKNKQAFNIICELPETVARTLVPRMRVVKGSGKAISYLTPPRILLALVTAWVRRGRWFDDQGRALYAAEADRIRNWAEDRTRFSFTDAMEMYTENTWVSVFSLSVVCAFIILSSSVNSFPGT
ncbi:putative chlorophyll(ide) b reductase NYC1, chloroplastic [Drosera capensis]